MNGPSAAHLDELTVLVQRRSPTIEDASAIDRLMALDRLAAAVAAATHTEIVRFADLALARQRAEEVPPRRLGEGIADQVALARRISPVTAARQVNRARLLTRELPCTFRLLATGQVSDWVATIVAGETRELNAADKATLDQDLASNLPGFGPREAEAAARRIAYRLDPHVVLRRSRAARVDRRVSIRPAPDTMALLSGLLPVEQGVAAWAALDRDAKTLKADGDLRSLSQLRADLMVQRLTGAETPTQLPVQISIVMPSGSLLDANDATPARLDGSGPIPADLARRLATNPDADVFIRRLFTDPVDATVTNADWRRRRFTSSARRLIAARDQTCRAPYCGAPIRHLDHVQPWRDSGPTTVVNGQGLCEHHNHTKERKGWRVEVLATAPHTTKTTTPTGHVYRSRAPSALGP